MKKIIMTISIILGVTTSANAWGQAYLQSCKYEYNSDYGKSGYVGTYKHSSGSTYSYFFTNTGWCPQTVDF